MDTSEIILERIEKKVDVLQATVEKSKKYLLIMLVGTIVMFILPLLIAAITVPMIMSTFSNMYAL